MATTKTPGRVTFADYAAQVVSSPYGAAVEPESKPTRGLESLNSQLMTHGWTKKPIKLDALSSKDLAHVVGVMFELLGSSVANLSTLDDLNARYRTLSYENERAQKQISAQSAARGRVEAEMMAWKARSEDIEKQLKAEREVVKELRDEVSRGKKAMESVKLAAVHDAKKSQMQLDKVQQQLARIANEPGSSRSQGLVMLNAVSGSRSHPLAPPQSTLIEQSVKDLADIREKLQEEADAFRHVVVSTGNALRDVIAMAEGREDPPRLMHAQFFTALDHPRARSVTHLTASSTWQAAIADSRLKSLVGDVKHIIMNGIDVALHTQQPLYAGPEDPEERQQTLREQERARAELEDRIKDLEVEIACIRAKEEEAQKVVEELSRAQASRETSPPDGIEEQLNRDLQKQRELLAEERRKFTEAAMRLGQERRHFETERNAFLEERRQADLDALQGYLPSSPSESNPASSSQTTLNHTEPLPVPIPPNSPWMAHRPAQPSPLSAGHKPRTPKVHRAGVKKIKTPLSRLVLEKGLKSKGKAAGQDELTELDQGDSLGVLGVEGGRRTNRPARPPFSTLGKSVSQDQRVVKLPKERQVSGTGVRTTEKATLTQSTKGVGGRRTASDGSTKAEGNLRTSGGSTGVPKKGAWR